MGLSSFFKPHYCLCLHLMLLGIPLRFGLLPTGMGRGWLIPESILDAPCSIFTTYGRTRCSPLEIFCIRDFGMRFLLQYELAWIIWFIMRRSPSNTVAFHKTLLGTASASLLSILWLQNRFHLRSASHEFNPHFFYSSVTFHLLAIVSSIWAIQSSPAPSLPKSMKWSIPGNAVFVGGVSSFLGVRVHCETSAFSLVPTSQSLLSSLQIINTFIAIAAFQALWRDRGLDQYYRKRGSVTSLVRICFALAAVQTLIHSVILFRLRTFLSMSQLRTVCLYKLVVGLVLPFVWFPELSPHVVVDQRTSLVLRGSLLSTYFLGFFLAGKAEGVSRLLSSEKEE
jgi:hypothetical protein